MVNGAPSANRPVARAAKAALCAGLVLLLALAPGCAPGQDPTSPQEPEATVEITLPASFFETQEMSPEEFARGQDFLSFEKGTDGSLTVRMGEPQHEALLSDLEAHINEALGVFLSEPEFAYIEDIGYTYRFREVSILVDRAAYEAVALDFVPPSVAEIVGIYRLFEGGGEGVTVKVIDYETREVLSEGTYENQ